MPLTPQQMADNWNAAMKSPTTVTKYKAGITATTQNPMQLAASPASMQLYLTNTQAAVTSGRMAAKLNSVPMSLWQNNSVNIGATNLVTGAAKGYPKMQSFFQRWAPIFAQASAAAHAIPKDGTINSALARVQATLQVLMAAKGT